MKISKSEELEKAGQKKSLREKLKENDLGLRLLVGFVCLLCLAAFLHFRELKVDILELNTNAGHYMVGQIDFEFPDEEATLILKQDAIRGLGNIYRIDEKQIRQARFEFENFLIQHRELKERGSLSDFDNYYKVADALEEQLLQVRFTDSKTLQRMKEHDFNTDRFFVFSPPNTEHPLLLPSGFWSRMDHFLLKRDFSEKTIHYVCEFFEKRRWSFQNDHTIQRNFRQTVEQQIPDRYTRVRAGTKIIDQGEKVTPRHIAMLGSMKQALRESRRLWDPLTIVASVLFATIFILLSIVYFQLKRPDIIRSLQKLSLIVCIIILTLILAKMTEHLLLQNKTTIIDVIRYPLIIPFATILVCILLGSGIALFTACFLSIILAITLAMDQNRFLIVNLVTSLIIIVSTRDMRRRNEVFLVCGKAWLSIIPILFAFSFSENIGWNISLGADFASSFGFLLITAILVVGLLPILESLFHVMTDMSLMEFMDPGNELLRRMTLEIPGTYQHCLVLGNIAEAAAQAIGANGLFCRVATLYHDIGKLNNPQFFTENQQGGVNIHQLLTPLESAQVIISHVLDGETLARKYRLPQSFIDVIREHHGTTLVYYFYVKQVELMGGEAEEVDQSRFRYPGPKPYSKESGIIMLADTIEAASRSLEETSEESLSDMVDHLISDKISDGQFNECQLTFEEVEIVKKTIVRTLMMSHHIRIRYPKRQNEN